MLTVRDRKGFYTAAPSWVFPGTVMENCAFLEGRVDEVALLRFEFETCLAYGRQEIPPELAALDLAYHAHLPLDLPWERGGVVVAEICLELLEKIRFLDVTRAVLHPPSVLAGRGAVAACRDAMAAFAQVWRAAGRRPMDVFLENTHENDLTCLEEFFLPQGETGRRSDSFGLCPDLGHILAYDQERFCHLLRTLPHYARPRMLHCSAPGAGIAGSEPESGHQPLDTLDAADVALGETLCSFLAPDAVIVVELFDWRYIQRSLPVLRGWLETIQPGVDRFGG